MISAAPGAAPGSVHPAGCLWEALCLQIDQAEMAFYLLQGGAELTLLPVWFIIIVFE